MSSQAILESLNVCGPVNTIDPLRDARWSAFIEREPRASVFHTPGWLDALRLTYGYRPLVYTTSPEGQDLENGMVFCGVESWLTGRRLVSLPFSDHCEPLLGSTEDLECLLGSLRTNRKLGGWQYIEVRPTSENFRCAALEAEFGPSSQYFLDRLDLRPPEGELFRRFHKSSIQHRIRKAERSGMTHECGRSKDLLEKFYQLISLTRRRHGIPAQPRRWFSNLANCMGDALEIHVASLEKAPVAAIMTLRFKQTAVYKYGGSDPAFHGLGSVPFVLWKGIQSAKSKGVQTFDFGRSDYDHRGLLDFKERWGCTRTALTYWRFPAPVKKPLRPQRQPLRLAKNCYRLLPSFVQRGVGEILYRHIG
jgi:hypothetical protein